MSTADRILVIGQNYKGTSMRLNGCHSDAALYFKFFESKISETIPNLVTKISSIRTVITPTVKSSVTTPVITSLPQPPAKILWLDHPYLITKNGVLRALDWLLSSATAEQFLDPTIQSFETYPLTHHTRMFFGYAGHGTNVKGKVDAVDQVLVTARGYVTDDEINQLLYTRMNGTSSFFGCVDSCCSGTIGDLRYCLNSPGKIIIDQNHAKDRIIPGVVQLISACHDDEQAAESDNGGLFTLTVIEQLQRYPNSTIMSIYNRLYNEIMVWGQQPVIASNVMMNKGLLLV